MKKYTLFIDPVAQADIQNGIVYYNDQVKGVGKKFHGEVTDAFRVLNEIHIFRFDMLT